MKPTNVARRADGVVGLCAQRMRILQLPACTVVISAALRRLAGLHASGRLAA